MRSTAALKDINGLAEHDLQTLTKTIHQHVVDYHQYLATHWVSGDDALKTLSFPQKSKHSLKRQYYDCLRALFDQIKQVKHPQHESILTLKQLLATELSQLKQAKWNLDSHDTQESAIEESLQHLHKVTHPIRTRDAIDHHYLQSLLRDIQDEAKRYRDETSHHLLGKDEDALTSLEAIQFDHSTNIYDLEKYHQILEKLHHALEKSVHQDNPHIRNLHQLLIFELQTQQESEWIPPSMYRTESLSIRNALSSLRDHGFYQDSQQEKFAQKWALDSASFSNQASQSSWLAFCENGWHIQDNHTLAISGTARSLLHIEPDASLILKTDHATTARHLSFTFQTPIFTLQTDDKHVKELEQEIRRLEKGGPKDKLKLSATNQALTNYKINLAKAEFKQLRQYHDQLKLWTAKNLTIFFIENIIEGQIKFLDSSSENAINDNDMLFKDMVDAFRNQFEDILTIIDRVHCDINNEFKLIKSLFHDHRISEYEFPIPAPYVTINPTHEADSFKNFVMDYLSEYTEPRHYQEALNRVAYCHESPHGMILPNVQEVIQFCKTPSDKTNTDTHDEFELITHPQKRTPFIAQRNIETFEIEKAAPVARSTTYNLLFGLVIGLMLGLMIAGIAAAIIFTGGAALGVGALIGVFGGIGAASILGGLLGGGLYSHQSTPKRTTNAYEQGSTAAAQRAFQRTPSLTMQGPQPGDDLSPAKNRAIPPPPEASPVGQSQHTPAASTPSEYRR